jgi:hypothetical protein
VKGSVVPKVLLALCALAVLMWLGSFWAAHSGPGGLHGAYRPIAGHALSELEQLEIDERLGVGNVATEFLAWLRESMVGNFGMKPPVFLVMAILFGMSSGAAATMGRRRKSEPTDGG